MFFSVATAFTQKKNRRKSLGAAGKYGSFPRHRTYREGGGGAVETGGDEGCEGWGALHLDVPLEVRINP